MKKIAVVTLILGSFVVGGCGGDSDPPPPPPPGPIVVTATLGGAAPDPFDVNDPIWNGLTSQIIPVAGDMFSTSGKIAPSSALAVSPNVSVKALVYSDTLYMQLVWDDATEDKWPARFSVTSLQELGPDTLAIFTRDILTQNEDQLMLLFVPPEETLWDVWNWRSVTTGAGSLAEGYRWTGANLVRDGGINAVAVSNLGDAGYPSNMHPNSPNNSDHILLLDEAIALQTNVDSVAWTVGDVVPGYMIDDDLWMETAEVRGSRFDIFAGQSYSAETDTYVVTLSRALNTGYEDDGDFSAHSTLKVKIGITNNSSFNMTQGDSKQGFTATFNLVLP